jgi:hypothetical protein
MATTSIDYKHPYGTIVWEHKPTGGSWQDATLLSGYVDGQGTKTLEIASATEAETGVLQAKVYNPTGQFALSLSAQLIATATAPVITDGITNQTPYEGQSATFGPITVTGSPTPTLLWEAEIADGSGTWDNADNIYGGDGSGQNTTTYTIANTQPSDNRDIRARATNTAGEDISQAALTVTPTLEFTTHPNNETITATP